MATRFDLEDSNRSDNPSIHDLSDPQRRIVLRAGVGALASGLLSPLVSGCAALRGDEPLLGFKSVPVSTA
ncbi:MAG: PhoX family phosphatase, partial [Burkholderiaceae bacterium]|nr:PhoX family phosphatase [Burkholderiaceae bacterium]